MTLHLPIVVAVVLYAGAVAPSQAPAIAARAPQTEVDRLQAAAAHGDPAAMYELGVAYKKGNGVPKDYSQAVVWFRKAAAAGNADAMNYLGVLHENQGFGVPHDEAQAAVWYGKAAKLGHSSSMFFLGIQYWAGRGVPQDFVEAYKWLHLSATYAASAEAKKRAADARDLVARARTMSPERIAEGQARARAWQSAFEKQKKQALLPSLEHRQRRRL